MHIQRIHIGIISVLVAISVLTTWQLWQPEYFRAHDFVHAARIAEMSRALKAGHIPPRWSANFGYGYGMPLFNFYAPLPFFIGAIVYTVLPIIGVLKVLLLASSLGTAFGMYVLSREYFGKTASVLAALAATLAPYRAVNMYVRGALSELWGMAWIPWTFLGVSRVISAKGGYVILSVSVAGMVLSHNLVALMTVAASAGWGVLQLLIFLLSKRVTLKEMLARSSRMLLAYLTGMGLSAWYVIPSLAEKRFTKLDETILTGYFDFKLHFLYIRQLFTPSWGYGGSEWGPNDGISFFIGYGQIVSLALSLLLITWLLWKLSNHSKESKSYVSVYSLVVVTVITTGCAFLLTLSHVKPFWEIVPFLQYLQFPWRWISVVTVLLGLLVAFVFDHWQDGKSKLFLGMILLVLLLLPVQFFKPESFLQNAADLYYTDEARIRSQMSEILPDYIPVDFQTEKLPIADNILTEQTGVTVQEHMVQRSHEHLLQMQLPKDQIVEFAIAYFPGWRAEVDGTPVLLNPTTNGLVSVAVPAGVHKVGLYFGESPIRRVANSISILFASWLVYYICSNRSKRA